MTDRDRLIDLMGKQFAELVKDGDWNFNDMISNVVDYILADGWIRPPCKVGDVVYDICQIFDESTLKPKTVIKPRTIDFVTKVGFIIESKGLVIGEKDFGKTVFLTKEDAEKALATDTNVGNKKEREGK